MDKRQEIHRLIDLLDEKKLKQFIDLFINSEKEQVKDKNKFAK